jgi:hypothetical protein
MNASEFDPYPSQNPERSNNRSTVLGERPQRGSRLYILYKDKNLVVSLVSTIMEHLRCSLGRMNPGFDFEILTIRLCAGRHFEGGDICPKRANLPKIPVSTGSISSSMNILIAIIEAKAEAKAKENKTLALAFSLA